MFRPLLRSRPTAARRPARWFVPVLFLLVPSVLAARERMALDTGWHFRAGDVPGAGRETFDVSGWREVGLPHDGTMAAEQRGSASPAGHDTRSAGAGWYRRSFHAPEHWQGQRVWLEFDAPESAAQVWLNGKTLSAGGSPNARSRFDASAHLRIGSENTIALRIEPAARSGRRTVSGLGGCRLTVVDPVHVLAESLVVKTTDVFPEAATIAVDAAVALAGRSRETLRAEVTVADPDGLPVAAVSVPVGVGPGGAAVHTKLAIPHPRSSLPDAPVPYRVIVRLFEGRRMTDRTEAAFTIGPPELTAHERRPDGGAAESPAPSAS